MRESSNDHVPTTTHGHESITDFETRDLRNESGNSGGFGALHYSDVRGVDLPRPVTCRSPVSRLTDRQDIRGDIRYNRGNQPRRSISFERYENRRVQVISG